MEKILILLTSETERTAMRESLEGKFDITICADFANVAVYLQREYDAIVLDLFLPYVDGFSFLEENRKACSGLILMLTKLISSDVLMQALDIGVDVLIRKPYDMLYLKNYLQRKLAKKNPSRVIGRGMESQEDTQV